MTPCRAEVLALALGLSGCLDEGRPWGEVTLAVDVAFSPPASRLDEAGRLKTANDFRVEVDAIEVVVAGAELLGQSDGASAFDPAAPPEGYSLCHNGHCHADDGRLVSYEDVAAALAGGGATTILAVDGGVVAVPFGGRATLLTRCAEAAPCEVATPTTVGLVRVGLGEVRVRGRAFEGRAGAARVPAEGVPFELVVAPEGLAVGATGGWGFGPDERVGLALEAVVTLPPGLFDGVAWDTMEAATWAAAVGEVIVEASGLEVRARRFD